jgi:hypothetical protein
MLRLLNRKTIIRNGFTNDCFGIGAYGNDFDTRTS